MSQNHTRGLSIAERARYALQRARGIQIETNLTAYRDTVRSLLGIDFGRLSVWELAEEGRRMRSGAGGPAEATIAPGAQAFALAGEACRRTLGLEPYDEQFIAALAMYEGKVAQMQTGEGKTLAAALAASALALGGDPVHILTANDYLARRDAEWMRPIYEAVSLTVGSVGERSTSEERRAAYACDVAYLTAKEGGFDLLRDELCYDRSGLVQRGLGAVIVDEADFILIDEARIPLVIAAADADPPVDPHEADRIAAALVPGNHVVVDRAARNVGLTTSGWHEVDARLGLEGAGEDECRNARASVHVALHARYLLHRDDDYIVHDGRIELVDDLTGRVAERRRWPYGIQRALEVKEGLAPRREGRVHGSITIQDYVHLYAHRAGMTATAVTAAAELVRDHGLPVVVIPPHRADRTVHHPDRVFATEHDKETALLDEIVCVHETGRPVLIGTRTVAESNELAVRLRGCGVACEVLNAANDEREAELVARAGMLGAVTVSTNMAGRGTDIKLGGDRGDHRRLVKELGGLYVIGTNRHESVRIDHQLRGRAGRQGDPGATRFFVSLEDHLVTRYAIADLLPAHQRGAESGLAGEIDDPRVRREIARAQEIIEAQHAAMRRTLRTYTSILERERSVVHDLRTRALCDGEVPEEIGDSVRDRVAAWRDAERAEAALVRLFLARIGGFWADHLALADELREGIHLQRLGQQNPLFVYLGQITTAFDEGLAAACDDVTLAFAELPLDADPESIAPAVASGPSSTWTYLVSDDPFPSFRVGLVGAGDVAGAFTAMAKGLALLLAMPARLLRRIGPRSKAPSPADRSTR